MRELLRCGLLDKDFEVFAVDLRRRGQALEPYTLGNMGNDLARFIATVIKRATITGGRSSGALLSAWLSASRFRGKSASPYVRSRRYFLLNSAHRWPIAQTSIGALFKLFNTYLGDQMAPA